VLISPVAHADSLHRMGVPTGTAINVGGFSEGQKRYLQFHREAVFLRLARSATALRSRLSAVPADLRSSSSCSRAAPSAQ
jgi:hypothetical protein